MQQRIRRGVGVVGLVLGATVLSACSAWPEPIATGMASGPTEAQLETAEDFGRWIDGLDRQYALDFDESAIDDVTSDYVSDWADDLEAVEELATSYPVTGSTVPALLNQAAAARSDALTAYRDRDFASGESSALVAAGKMQEVREALAEDAERVEAACDCRVATDGRYGGLEPVSPDGRAELAEVVEWIDGDTVETSEGRVRLIGIDTPEMEDECSAAEDAKRNAEAIAPPGTEVELVSPYSVDDKDGYGRLLRYVDVPQEGEDGQETFIDVGYSQILSRLAVARYDSYDGYQWHPREGDYREASGAVDRDQLQCLAPAAALAANEEDEDDENRSVLLIVAGLFAEQIDDAGASAQVAREVWVDHDEFEERLNTPSSGGSGGSSGGSGGDYRYCRGWFCIG